MAEKMKGAILPGDSTVEFRDYEIPGPGHGQVLVRTKASTICGSDIRAISVSTSARDPRVTRASSPGMSPPVRSRRRAPD
jgi:threonine dehydrogenase-like Zn-dependent dehydrogenase